MVAAVECGLGRVGWRPSSSVVGSSNHNIAVEKRSTAPRQLTTESCGEWTAVVEGREGEGGGGMEWLGDKWIGTGSG